MLRHFYNINISNLANHAFKCFLVRKLVIKNYIYCIYWGHFYKKKSSCISPLMASLVTLYTHLYGEARACNVLHSASSCASHPSEQIVANFLHRLLKSFCMSPRDERRAFFAFVMFKSQPCKNVGTKMCNKRMTFRPSWC